MGLPLGSVVCVTQYMSTSDHLWMAGTPAVAGLGGWSQANSRALTGHHVLLLTDHETAMGRVWQQTRGIRRHAASVKVAPACPTADPEGEPTTLDDFIKVRGVPELLHWALEAPGLEAPSANGRAHPDLLAEIFTAAELQHMEIPEPRWVVPGLLAEGVCLVAGRPKIGKSWLALQTALAVASPAGRVLGRPVTDPGAVLYVALEDYKGRLKSRVARLQEEVAWPERLYFQNASPTARGPLGVQLIEAWCQRMADQRTPARLVIVDTMEQFRQAPERNRSVYHEDLEALLPLRALAQRWHLVIMVIDHRRKAEAEDIFDTVGGSAAKTGTVDSTWIVERARVQRVGKLTVTGRDIEEQESALEFDPSRCIWTILSGDTARHLAPPQHRRILAAMQPEGIPKSPNEITLAVGMTRDRVNWYLKQMEQAGLVSRWSYGKWVAGEGEDILGDTPSPTPPPLSTQPTPPTHPTQSTPPTQSTQQRSGETVESVESVGGVGEGVEACPECGQLWTHAGAAGCPSCDFKGKPIEVELEPGPE